MAPLTAAGSARAWLLAARPATLSAGAVPVAVGTALAAAEGRGALLPACVALAGALWIQIGANLANDAADFERGADTHERTGPARAAQLGLLSPHALRAGTAVAFALAALCGAYLVVAGGWPIAVGGSLALLAGYAYTAGPLPLGYRGLGDLLVFVFFGVFAVVGTHYVQAGEPSLLALAASLPVGLLAVAILAVNNLRDIDSDRRADKRTLAVRLGERGARRYTAALLGASYASLLVFAAAGAPFASVLLPLASAPRAFGLWQRLRTARGSALNRELVATARLQLAFAALLALGLLL